ncbi:N-acyl homoserine lactonase family protein [Saccharolobus caldissimus]|uniref:MBL fold metallo-hydrolase n=1 Tax=Saccharolobus caldissimus TaxID=1702097 RepID=A0AAQ4CRE9_9CREN|nr:N-acyl homoserine lactonase family protein [Saccharolobus caldissimus]BDB98380.1 MBL fold metallo-hydrolase [Saccharolobus caldissimus]
MKAKKIYLLDLGMLGGDSGWFLPGAAGGAKTYSNRNATSQWIEVPVSAALIEHPEGYILFDTGIAPDAMQTHEKGLMEAFPIIKFSEENKLEKQLALVNVKPEDIKAIVISHLHLDHIGQASIFKDLRTPIFVQKKELEYALLMLWQGKGGAYDYSDLAPLRGANWIPIADEKFEIAEGVIAEFTGGHTPGHQVLHVTTEAGNTYILTGDYLHLVKEMEIEAKGWLLGDAEEWHTYIRKLKYLVSKPKTKLVAGHDVNLWNTYPKAPKALE